MSCREFLNQGTNTLWLLTEGRHTTASLRESNCMATSTTLFLARRMMINVTAVDGNEKPLPGVKFQFAQTKPAFPFGTAINAAILKNPFYQKWFASRFTVTTFENEMKWYGTEFTKGHEDYSVADAMLKFANENGVHVRGHNVFWDDQNAQMSWVSALPKAELQEAVTKRINSVVNRYKGKVIHWDVVNENVHFNFFENKLSPDASVKIFQEVQKLDPNVLLFMNDFNTLEVPGDPNATPDRYLKKFNEIRAGNPNAKMAIGLESHFEVPNIPYMRSVLDKMATTNVPIWLTEVDVAGTDAKQAKYLEEILREGYAHPAVKGIVMWASWTPKGCYRMCLTDNQFKNFPVGDLVDSLIKEWKTHAVGTTGEDGTLQAHLAHGEYEVRASHPSKNITSVHKIKVDADSSVHKLQIHH
ncbi:Endo-1,4-beta-xylanase C [Carex littledalei]|uniref:Endo-1,4-beta-xylanase C n=1 Tax=Carex littledalei TaxID=544730 RepID=A0A833VJV5_9POAL|nr:Endo-1,4-beta-xylanase C [Carex littledalei]